MEYRVIVVLCIFQLCLRIEKTTDLSLLAVVSSFFLQVNKWYIESYFNKTTMKMASVRPLKLRLLHFSILAYITIILIKKWFHCDPILTAIHLKKSFGNQLTSYSSIPRHHTLKAKAYFRVCTRKSK